jgi:hypothetical protein
MSKYILNKTKQQFVEWFNQQDNMTRYVFATTPIKSKTQPARFRRLYLRTMNAINRAEISNDQPKY